MAPTSPLLNIAIIGAGPAGLMLARLLTTPSTSTSPKIASNIKITIFEADPTPVSRTSNGGTLDLHSATGLLAVKRAGLYDEFLKKARYDGTSALMCDKKGKVLIRVPPSREGSTGNPEIDRVELRGLLLGSLEGEEKVRICWGMKTKSVGEKGERFEVEFVGGETRDGFDLVIGADGAWSKTRTSYLDSATKLEYSRVMGFCFSIPDAEVNATDEWKFTNKGSVFAFGDGKEIVSQQLGDGSLHVNAWVSTEGEDQPALITKTNEEILEEYFEDWSEQLKSLLRKAGNKSAESKLMFALPGDYEWEHRKGVTLLGDSAHVMLPFAGEGVNLAFEDAMKLCDAILQGEAGTLDDRMKSFEKDLFYRAKRAQKMTRGMTKAMIFTPGAPWTGVESWILCKIEYELPLIAKWAWPVALAAVYGWFFVVKLIY